MKALCIHLPYRKDREQSFSDGIGRQIPFEWLAAVDKRKQDVVSDYAGCVGDLCCRASHAIAWMRALQLQENVLIFEDDARTIQKLDWTEIVAECEQFKGNHVLFFSAALGRSEGVSGAWSHVTRHTPHLATHAYMVTPQSAAVLLEHHLRIVNPVTMVQMSVDRRIRQLGRDGYLRILNHRLINIYQLGVRAYSDNEWKNPTGLGREIISPATEPTLT